jgi:c-di-GMP-specific phosphodiesterase
LMVDHSQHVLLHYAAPSLPPAFCRAIDRLPIAEGMSACGSAVARNETVVVEDVLTDPLTKDFVGLARKFDLRAVWSQPLRNRDGSVTGAFAVYRSVPHRPDDSEVRSILTAGSLAALAIERSQTYRELSDAANFDSLTGLTNRAAFLKQVDSFLRRADSRTAVMFLDLDGFKWINDSLGHPAGDRILQQVARRLASRLDGDHLIARFGGDEFTILLSDPVQPVIEAALVAVQHAFDDPFELDGGEFFLSCCTGVAVSDGATDPYGLIQDADTAMFAAKERGRAKHVSFDSSLRERAVARVTLESDIRRAIERDEFVMHYQPVVDIRSGGWTGVEALVRWQHPAHGLVPPSDFIPLAEESGLIVPLGQHVLEKVISERAAWPDPDLKVAINMSVVQLADRSAGTLMGRYLDTYGLAPQLVVLEVTETAVMQRVETARSALEDVIGLGATVVIDDFGTGYSSIARLGDLPVSGVKIDLRFTRTLGRDPKAARVVGAMTDLAHAHGLYVVVEGIETAEALESARQLGCEQAQGYYLCRPAAARDLLKLHSLPPRA